MPCVDQKYLESLGDNNINNDFISGSDLQQLMSRLERLEEDIKRCIYEQKLETN